MIEAYSRLDGIPKQDAQPDYYDALQRIESKRRGRAFGCWWRARAPR